MKKEKYPKRTAASFKKNSKPVKNSASRPVSKIKKASPALKAKPSLKAGSRSLVSKKVSAAANQEFVTDSLVQSKSIAYADLPFSYNETKLVLLVRDPTWAYTYWDFSSETWDWIQNLCRRDRGTRPKLRIHNLERGHHFDVDVTLEAKNWYVDLGLPNTPFEAELGLLDSQGRFHTIVKSNRVRTPRNAPSETIDPRWEALEFDEIYKLSGGGKTGHGSEIFSHFKRP